MASGASRETHFWKLVGFIDQEKNATATEKEKTEVVNVRKIEIKLCLG